MRDTSLSELSHSPPNTPPLRKTQLRNTPAGEHKPNPHILQSICEEIGAEIDSCVYIGDNLMKDVAMAQELGMTDVHALYGKAQHRPEYEILKAVTHWTSEMVAREAEINAGTEVQPSVVLKDGFWQISDVFGKE